MIKIMILSPRGESFASFNKALLEKDFADLVFAGSGEEALGMVASKPVDLVAVDQGLEDMTNIQFAEKLISVNPMINCALVSSLPHDEFHEATEGLGVLAQLPKNPGKKDAESIIESLKKIM